MHFLNTRVEYKPQKGEGQMLHQGLLIYHTTDDFYRVRWDEPNPDPDFFNLERVFKYECLVTVKVVCGDPCDVLCECGEDQ